jgi:hypothetical protein
VACDSDHNAASKTKPGCASPLTRNDEFSQTLGKRIFLGLRFELSENLRLILLDYAQKRADAANIAFNAAC